MNKRNSWFLVSSAVLALLGALPSCSSDASSASSAECKSFAACGGDLSGTWHVSAACLSDSTNTEIADAFKVCPAATVSLASIDYSGTVSFTAGTEQSDLTVAAKLNETIPTSCLSGQSCAVWQAAFAAQGSKGVSNATCQANSDGCACAFDLAARSTSTAAYTLSGTTFTDTDASDGSMETSEYCVASNQLTVKSADGVIALSR